MGYGVEHATPLLDGGLADGLSQVTFAGASRPFRRTLDSRKSAEPACERLRLKIDVLPIEAW